MTDKKGLYIHIPFCKQKCNYCDFVSYTDKYGCIEKYFNKMILELKSYGRYNVDTVYIGGGTPSSVDEKYIGRLLDCVYSHFAVDRDAEITIEVNPDSVDRDKLCSYKKNGINRISMGAQSFDDDELKTLGRLHNAEDIVKKFNIIREVGFDNVSLDLMFGLPGQTSEKLCKSIDSILKLSPEHISCYGLKIEEGTPFYKDYQSGKLSLTEDDYFADLYELMCSRIAANGYMQYEISNYCLPGKHSRHNVKYWQCNEYIGIGAAASSYLNNIRSKNTDEILEYKNINEEILTEKDKMIEFVIFGLRMTDNGISIPEFKKRFGVDIFDVFSEQLKKQERFIKRHGQVLKLTKDAYYISNSILMEFID